MDKRLAFVLGGGGSLGALQVGAMKALLESGLQPDLVVGTSIGAVNSTFIALNGFSRTSLDRLEQAWHTVIGSDILPSNFLWQYLRSMMRRSGDDSSQRIRQLFVENGIHPGLRFAEIGPPQLVVVSADLNSGKPILHGEDPDGDVLESLMLSIALPPWVHPVEKQNQFLMDGGAVSNLPVEPAMNLGATAIVALDLGPQGALAEPGDGRRVERFLNSLVNAVERRQAELELQLAAARGVPTLYFGLNENTGIPMWDFKRTHELIAQGYAIARRSIEEQQENEILRSLGER